MSGVIAVELVAAAALFGAVWFLTSQRPCGFGNEFAAVAKTVGQRFAIG